ncbi:MAG TPA: hypothetical protein VGJ26_02950, partial [Pirellulales bacterium]
MNPGPRPTPPAPTTSGPTTDSSAVSPADAAQSASAHAAQMADERDARLVVLLEDLSGQLRRGEQPDVEMVARANPDLAEELRRLFATLLVTDCVAAGVERFSSHDQPTHTLAPGKELPAVIVAGGASPRRFGDYELLEELGRGGMGVVYKARQISLGRIVALKVMLRGDMASGADLARFRSEAESAAHLDHPGIVPVYEVGDQDGQPYFTMK